VSVALSPVPTSAPPTQARLRWELVVNLVRKDLKVKYQGSVLGFAWSLANPLLVLVVYTFVFGYVLRSTIPRFGLYLLSGLLIWNFLSLSVTSATTSILANAGLVKKVPMPHVALPMASVGFAGVQVALQFVVLIVVALGIQHHLGGVDVLLLVPAVVVALTLTVGLALLTSALNVRYRDTQHMVEISMFAWFFLNPIVYSVTLIQTHMIAKGWGHLYWMYYLNPMAGVVVSFQRAIYGTVVVPGAPAHVAVAASPGHVAIAAVPAKLPVQVLASTSNLFYLEVLGIGFAVALVVLALGATTFRRLSADFAEDL